MRKEETALMKNSQKGFFHIFATIFEKLHTKGIKVTLKKIVKNINYKLKGVDFSMQELSSLDIKSENLKYATICGSSAQETVDHVLKTLLSFDKNLTEGRFIDIGSGKGKLLLQASNFGFKVLEGVEFSYTLCEKAKQNLQRLKIKNIKINHLDACDYRFPSDTRVVYFLNPFTDRVFKKVLANLLKDSKNFTHDIYIVYRAPIFKEVFSTFYELKHIKSDLFQGDQTEFYLLKRKIS